MMRGVTSKVRCVIKEGEYDEGRNQQGKVCH